MPAKHQPDFIYLRHVPLRKVHLFTVTQLTCLVLLWVIKTSPAAIVFPMMVRWPPAPLLSSINPSILIIGIISAVPPGTGPGFRSQGTGLVLLQERAKLPGRLDAWMEEKKSWWCLQKDRGGSPNVEHAEKTYKNQHVLTYNVCGSIVCFFRSHR